MNPKRNARDLKPVFARWREGYELLINVGKDRVQKTAAFGAELEADFKEYFGPDREYEGQWDAVLESQGHDRKTFRNYRKLGVHRTRCPVEFAETHSLTEAYAIAGRLEKEQRAAEAAAKAEADRVKAAALAEQVRQSEEAAGWAEEERQEKEAAAERARIEAEEAETEAARLQLEWEAQKKAEVAAEAERKAQDATEQAERDRERAETAQARSERAQARAEDSAQRAVAATAPPEDRSKLIAELEKAAELLSRNPWPVILADARSEDDAARAAAARFAIVSWAVGASPPKGSPKSLSSAGPASPADVVVADSDEAAAFNIYNEMADRAGLTRVQLLSHERKRSLKQRLKEVGGLDGWRHACETVEKSPFLTGDNKSGWVASFDFLVQKSSLTKVMEGTYDRREPTKRKSRGEQAAENVIRRMREKREESV